MYNCYYHVHWLPTICMTLFLFTPMMSEWNLGADVTEEENLNEVNQRVLGMNLPTGALNFRKSAHFIEINSIYGAEMTRRVGPA